MIVAVAVPVVRPSRGRGRGVCGRGVAGENGDKQNGDTSKRR